MALTNDPRDDLRYIDDELRKPMSETSRSALENARQRCLIAIAEYESSLVCPDCELGPDQCECIAYDDIRPARGEAA